MSFVRQAFPLAAIVLRVMKVVTVTGPSLWFPYSRVETSKSKAKQPGRRKSYAWGHCDRSYGGKRPHASRDRRQRLWIYLRM